MKPGGVAAVVVGAGLMGRWHAHAIRRIGSTIAGVVDVDPLRAGELAARHRGARPFGDLDNSLEALAPDIVHVCTPTGSHVPLVRSALRAGCHVLAEKPLAQTARETQDLLMLADQAGRLLVPVHQFVWQRGALQLADRLPALAPILHLELAAASAGAAGASDAVADAVAADILPHFLALTRWLLGGRLAEAHWAVERPRAGEWRVTGRCGLVPVQFLVSMSARPTFAELRLLGAHGSARLDLFHGFAVFEGDAVSRVAKVARPFGVAARSFVAASHNVAYRALAREPAYPGLMELIRRVHLAAAGTGETPVRPEETLDIACVRDRLVGLAAGAGRA